MHQLLLLLAVSIATAAAADPLAWDATTIVHQAEPTDDAAIAVYRFRNQSSKPIHLSILATSCGCTTGQLDQVEYAAGESGKISVIFEYGAFEGFQQKTITVAAEAAEEEPSRTVLTLQVQVPRLGQLNETRLDWTVGGQPEARIARLALAPDSPVRLKSINLLGQGFRMSTTPIPAPDGEYTIAVVPVSCASAANAVCEALFDLGEGRTRRKLVFLHIIDPSAH